MEVKVVGGDITRFEAGAIIVDFFEGTKQPEGETARVDAALGGAMSQLISQGEIKGKCKEITIIHSMGKIPAGKVAVCGLGKKSELKLDIIRGAVAETCRLLRRRNAGTIATIPLGVGIAGITANGSSQAITEGAMLGLYTFRKHITKEPEYTDIKEITIIDSDRSQLPALEQGCRKGQILADATNLTRDMVNEPANFMTPADMAETASRLASEYKLELIVYEREKMKDLGMGALLGVAQGSQQPPRFIVLRYKAGNSAESIALVGKGITFDSGGISLKPSEGMGEMKGDMAGGAAVMAAMTAIAQLKPKINVIGIVPATENMPSGTALKPG
ncbi:MAG: M17 family peptidase N-terminal domain-containing protein, partial [Chloroflexota bacterium]